MLYTFALAYRGGFVANGAGNFHKLSVTIKHGNRAAQRLLLEREFVPHCEAAVNTLHSSLSTISPEASLANRRFLIPGPRSPTPAFIGEAA